MRIKLSFVPLALAGFIVLSCNSSTDIEKKKEELKELKKEMVNLKAQISKIEKELLEQDSTFVNERDKSVLVALEPIIPRKFEHRISVRGAIASQKNVMLSAEAMANVVRIHVREGESVRQGQILVELDAQILQNNIQELKTALELASTLYEKQKNLWDQNIGTEVQYLQAKNNKESLERKLKTTRSQLENYFVKAPFSGRVYELDVKLGSMLSPGMPVCRVVSLEDMYIQADVSESLVGKFEVGDTVDIEIPAMNIMTKSTINAIGKVINVQNRTFQIEVKLPKEVNGDVRPNQVTVLTITDYVKDKAITIPSKVVQKDGTGNYIYIARPGENGMVAKKQHITIGKSYNLSTEVLSGLDSGAKILTEGYRDVADGALITVAG